MKALKDYRSAGLELDRDLKEPPDHVAVELEFMHYLIFREADSLRRGDYPGALEALRRQDSFLSDRLAPWMPAFCGKIESASESPFYRSLAGCVRTFVCQDEPLKVLPRRIRRCMPEDNRAHSKV